MSDQHDEADQADDASVTERLRTALWRVVLLRETGPKSAAWQRARVRTIWHLHHLLEQQTPPDTENVQQHETAACR